MAWSPGLWHLYTCKVCGLRRQSVPGEDGRYKTLYGVPLQGGDLRWQEGPAPTCPVNPPSELFMVCRQADGSVCVEHHDPDLARQHGWSYLAGPLPAKDAYRQGFRSAWGSR